MKGAEGPRLTVRDRILVHLAESGAGEGEAIVPLEVTQTGLARAAAIEQRHVAQYVRPLVRDGLVVERMAHVRGGKQRRRAYFVTTQGRQEAGRLRGNLLRLRVEVEVEGRRRTMALGEAAKGPLRGAPLLEILRAMEAEVLLRAQGAAAASARPALEELPFQLFGPAYAAPGGSPLVDRVVEMERLRGAVEDLKGGRGGCLLLIGEAGIGKSRLALEVSALASQAAVPFLMGQATEYGGAPPLAPWTEALRGFFLTTPPSLLKELVGPHGSVLARILPDLSARLGLQIPTVATSTELERYQLSEAVAQLLINASRVRPLILFLDDLQWADDATLQLLTYVHRNAASERILILGSYRPEDVGRDAPLEAALHEMGRTRRLEKIPLERLAPDDVRTLVTGLLETTRIDPKLASLVVDRAGGNPFFTEELVFSLRQEGDITVQKGEAAWTGGGVRLPDSLHRLIRRRLARCQPPTQELLLSASVLGQRLRPEVLSKISVMEWDALVDSVDEALERGFLMEDPHGTEGDLLFSDELIRGCLYESLSQIRRRMYHRRAADVLVALPSPSMEEVGYHYAEARLPDPARRYLEAAGDEAMAIAACQRAAERFERALAFTPEEDAKARRRLLVKLGSAYSAAGKPSRAKDAYLQAKGYPADSRRDEAALGVRLAEVLLELWDPPALRQELKDVLAILEGDQTSDAARALNILCWMLQDMEGDAEGSLRAGERALTMAEAIGDAAQTALALDLLLSANVIFCRWEEAEECASRLMATLEADVEKPEEAAGRYNDLGIAYFNWVPNYPRALECFARGLQIARRLGDDRVMVIMQMQRARGYSFMGRWKEAEAGAEAALAVLRDSDDCQNLAGPARLFPAVIMAHRGELAAAEREIQEALATPGWHEDLPTRVRAYEVLARVRSEGGDIGGAREALRSAFEVVDRLHGSTWPLNSLYVTAAHVESMAEDPKAFEASVRWLEERGSPSGRASLAAIKVRWSRLHGTPSVEGLREAEDYWRHIGNPFELATALHEHALTLVAISQVAKAKAPWEEALRIYSDLGEKKRVEELLKTKGLFGP